MHCHRCNRRGPRRRQRGAALIVAMLVFALATALVVAMKSEFERYYQRSANLLLDEQAQAYLRSAEELAGMVLLADYDKDKGGLDRDDLKEGWSPDPEQGPATYPLDEGWMRGTLEDLQGRFNLNALAQRTSGEGTDRFTAAQEQFIRLLQALGDPEVTEQEAIVITQAVTDWLDADTNPGPDGAEDEFYGAQTPAYRAANRAMSSVSELRAVANMTPQIYQALLPWVTVWPSESTKLNIHTAPAMVLRTINEDKDLSPLSAAEGEELVKSRDESETGFKDLDDFLKHPVLAGKKNMGKIRQRLVENTDYFLLEAEVEVAGRNMRLYSVLNRTNRKISALARASGSL